MSAKSRIPKVVVALGLKDKVPTQVASEAAHYVLCMTGNPNFPNPVPALSLVSTQVQAVLTACDTSLSHGLGSVDLMHLALQTLSNSLKLLSSYVENVANTNRDTAAAVLASSGMPEKKPRVSKPKVFSAVLGKIQGTVVLNTKAIVRGAYIYQMSTDPNNASSWVTIYSSTKVKFTKTGLTSGVRYYFRVATSSKGEQADWSHVLNVLVP